MAVFLEFQDPVPVVEDQTVRAYCFYCQSLRAAAAQILLSVIDTSQPFDKHSWAAVLIIQRLTRISHAE